jgi:glutathione S-transferase
MITLYDLPLSGHAHRVRLMPSLLQLDYQNIYVDLSQGEHRTEAFLALNPFGQVPVLVDDELVIRDSAAILVYLARQYGPQWYPDNPVDSAHIQQWLATATKEIATGPGAARLVTVFNANLDHPQLIKQSHELLAIIEQHLVNRSWLAIESASIADIAAYSYIAHAPEGGVALDNYPNIRRWLNNIEQLPNFVAMPATTTAIA